MSDLRPDNGNDPPQDDRGRGLSGLPPEWGTIVIPDDPSELADEADQIRRELRGETQRHRARRRLLPDSLSAIAIPLGIMAMALFTTMVSLLVVTWGNQPQAPLPSSRPPVSAGAGRTAPAGPDLRTPLAELVFATAGGDPVRLGDVLPAVVLLVDGCACDPLVSGVAAAVPPGVHVLAVGTTAPPAAAMGNSAPGASAGPSPGTGGRALSSAASKVVRVADPVGTLRARYFAKAAPTGGAARALVVNRSAKVVATIPRATQVTDIPVPVG